jgi:hypothetical protein
MRARCDGSMWMVTVTRGHLADHADGMAVPREVFCHIHVARPRMMVVLSRRPISAALDRVMTYSRRGAVCQSRNVPGGVEQNTTPVAPWRAVNSGRDARSRSSRCDSPSSPVYQRTTPIETPPPGLVVFCRSPAEVSDPGEPVPATVGHRRRGTPPPPPHGHGYCSPRVCVATPLETDTARRRSLGPRAYTRRSTPSRHHQPRTQRDRQPRVRRATLHHVPAIH